MDIFGLPRFGLLVPPENPVAEPEFMQLLGSEMNVYTTRFPVTPEFTLETMEMYNKVLPEVLATFGQLRLDAVVVACNASHYLLNPAGDREFLAELSERFGFPVRSSSQAILDLLSAIGTGRLTLVTPYAPWLTDISRSFWEQAGLTVNQIIVTPAGEEPRDEDEHYNPYLVTTKTILDRVRAAKLPEDETVLFTGTGMATLTAVAELAREEDRRTLLTSNAASAWWARRTAGVTDGEGTHPLIRRLGKLAAR
ncbi:arylmalonate decarboxylase [Kitasatospora sp. NPDC006697]|uniref:maleate cis-trans isomerase family protein n=1 Tax=Kitasatospora sp. NPDC006697 TaxID=3364020 RepID=UPI00368AB1C0